MRHILIFCLALVFALPVQARGGVEDVSDPATDLVNAIRAQNGLPGLRAEERLAMAAATHAQDMIRKGFFGHTGSNGSSIGKRAQQQRYGPCVISENIAKGHPDLKQVLRAWMNSRGHRRNLLNAQVTDFALVRGRGDVWVMMLGRPGC